MTSERPVPPALSPPQAPTERGALRPCAHPQADPNAKMKEEASSQTADFRPAAGLRGEKRKTPGGLK